MDNPTANKGAACTVHRGTMTWNPTSKAKSLIKGRVDSKLLHDPLRKLKNGNLTRIMKLVDLYIKT